MEELRDKLRIENIRHIRDIVYEQIRTAILSGALKPGERIVEKDYAEKFNVSRTPIREALRKLEFEGLVAKIPRKGDVVTGINFDDVIEIFAIRNALEKLLVQSVIERITDDEIEKLREILENMEKANESKNIPDVIKWFQLFHEFLLNAGQMPRLKNIMESLQDYLARFRLISLSNELRRNRAIVEHREIFNAIVSKDVERSLHLVAEHTEAAKKALLKMGSKELI